MRVVMRPVSHKRSATAQAYHSLDKGMFQSRPLPRPSHDRRACRRDKCGLRRPRPAPWPRRRPRPHRPCPRSRGRRASRRTSRIVFIRACRRLPSHRLDAAGLEQALGETRARREVGGAAEAGEEHLGPLPGAGEVGVAPVAQALEGLGEPEARRASRWARPADAGCGCADRAKHGDRAPRRDRGSRWCRSARPCGSRHWPRARARTLATAFWINPASSASAAPPARSIS